MIKFWAGLAFWIHAYGTRALAVAAGTITTLCSTGIVPAAHMQYYMAALAVLTYWRGQSTSNTYDKTVRFVTDPSPFLTPKPESK